MERYDCKHVVGRGTYGSAVVATRRADGLQCVIKTIALRSLSRAEAKLVRQEARLLATLRHPHIVSHLESFGRRNSSHNREICIVMEYCAGGDLEQWVARRRKERKKPSENTALRIFAQTCMALEHVHAHRVVHRDVKTSNLFVARAADMSASSVVKLGDFGISRVLGATGDLAATAVGTPCYMAPELLDERPYDYKADVWSAGCVLFELLNLKRAFEARSMPALVRLVMRGRGVGFPVLDASFSTYLRRLFATLLSPKPRDRPDIVEILQAPVVAAACDRVRDGYAGEASPPPDAAELRCLRVPRPPKPPARPAQPVDQKRRVDAALPAAKQRLDARFDGARTPSRPPPRFVARARAAEERVLARAKRARAIRGRGERRLATLAEDAKAAPVEEDEDAASSCSSSSSDDEPAPAAPPQKSEKAEYKALGGGWWFKRDAASNRWFYVNEATGHSQWDLPDGVSAGGPRADGPDAAAAKRVRDAVRARVAARAGAAARRAREAAPATARPSPPAPAAARRSSPPAPEVPARRSSPSAPAPVPVRRSSQAAPAPARRQSPAPPPPPDARSATAPAQPAASWLGSLEARMGRLREQLGGLPQPPPAVHRVAIPFAATDGGLAPPSPPADGVETFSGDDPSPARKENTPPPERRPSKGSALAAARVRERAKQRADAESATAAAKAAADAREAAQPSAVQRRASARDKSRAEFRAKIAADRRGRSPSKRDDRVEILVGPIPPMSPARPVAAPVSPGTTDAEVQDLVAKLRATLARRKDKAPSDDDVVRAVLAGRRGEEFFDAHS